MPNPPLAGLFTDTNLQACIDSYATANGWVNALDVVGVPNGAYTGVIACDNNDPIKPSPTSIINLAGMEYLVNVEQLWLWGNEVTDVSALQGLPNLVGLSLANNNIGSLDAVTGLSSLTNLKNLWLYSNKLGNSVGMLVRPEAPMPNAPAGVTATAGDQQVTLDWTIPAGVTATYTLSWENIDPFAINTAPNSGNLLGSVANVTPPFTATNLINGETYKFYLTQEIANSSKLTTSVFGYPKPQAPNVPLTVSAQKGDGSAIINWTTKPGATYTLSAWGEFGNPLPNIPGATPPLTFPGLINGQTYYIRVEENSATSSLAALSTLVNLTELDLSFNNLDENDLTSLSTLGVLAKLYVNSNEITDISNITSAAYASN